MIRIWALLPLLLAWGAEAQAGIYRTFQDWQVGCDNGLRCVAIGKNVKPVGLENDGIRLVREAGPKGALTFSFLTSTNPSLETMILDQKPFKIAPVVLDEKNPASHAAIRSLMMNLANASTLAFKEKAPDEEVLSLRGLKAALLFMDDQQGRVGSNSAFIAVGERESVAKPPAYPLIRAIAAPQSDTKLPASALKLAIAYHRKHADRKMCDIGFEGVEGISPEVYPIAKGLFLMEFYCWRAAYQAGSVFALYDAPKKAMMPAPFEMPNIKTGTLEIRTKESATNPDIGDGSISAMHKGRGVGGCGESMSWQWDGKLFRLTSHAIKFECNHPNSGMRLFRVQVRGVDGTTSELADDSEIDGEF